jgi:hypothetical protein
MRGCGSQSSATLPIRAQVDACFWLRRRSVRPQSLTTFGLVLEADHDVVRITHDHHVASSLAPSPARRPEIENVVQVDVGQKR